jgi:hypothetical protein
VETQEGNIQMGEISRGSCEELDLFGLDCTLHDLGEKPGKLKVFTTSQTADWTCSTRGNSKPDGKPGSATPRERG